MTTTTTFAAPGAARSELETSTIRAISWRLIPFLVLAYFFSYLDRVNLGFAALTMNAELKFSPTVFAWGAGIFFIGYFLFEVPSNLALEKFGASRWIARIMVTWGIISGLMALVSGVWSFYGLRFLLGVAEAGFFPGIILYLTYWYPAEYRARFLAAFAIAVPVSSVIGAPVSGLLLGLDGAMGLRGWQWLFVIEGIPSRAARHRHLVLSHRPAGESRLADVGTEGLAVLETRKRNRRQKGRAASDAGAGAGLAQGDHAEPDLFRLRRGPLRHAVLAAADRKSVRLYQRADRFCHGGALSLRHRRDDPLGAAFRCHPRARDACRLPLLLTALALAVCGYMDNPYVTMVALIVAAIGIFGTFAVFWTLPTAWLSGTAAAGAIALINSIGNLAGFGGPYLIGWVKEATGSTSTGLLVLAVLPLIGGLLVFLGGHETKAEFAAAK